jgi:hypothetical protein
MNFFLSIVRRESSSDGRRSSSVSSRSTRNDMRARRQANILMDRIGRIEDRG